jgi:hypothetical protein
MAAKQDQMSCIACQIGPTISHGGASPPRRLCGAQVCCRRVASVLAGKSGLVSITICLSDRRCSSFAILLLEWPLASSAAQRF